VRRGVRQGFDLRGRREGRGGVSLIGMRVERPEKNQKWSYLSGGG